MVEPPKDPEASDASAPEDSSDDGGIVRAVLSGGAGIDEDPESIALGELVRGTTVGHYVILSQLSGDDEDSVYAAFDTRTDRKVALKVVEVTGIDDDDAQSRREGMIAAAMRSGKLEHPAIVAVLDAGTVGDAVYVAMEFIDGIDLRQWMEARDEPFPWPEVLRVFREAGAGLAAAHAAGSVHGDFTPSRVFMEKSGRICVFDFGLATPVAEVSSPRLTVQSLEKELGVDVSRDDEGAPGRRQRSTLDPRPRPELLGTPRYLAPELHAGIEPDAKADQFAFCAAMYEALYGEVPFKGDSPATIASEALNHNVRPAPEGSDVPQWLRDVLVKGMSPRRRDRFPSMEVLLRQLEHDPVGRRRRWVVGVAALTTVAATAGGIAFLLDRESTRCDADATLLEGSWDSNTRAGLEEAFLATRAPHAADSWEQVQTSMDDWAAQWLEYHSLACKVRQADGDDVLLERRNACLQGVLQPFTAFASDITENGATTQIVDGAQRVVTGLWRPADCRSLDMLDYAMPSDALPKAAVDEAWLRLLSGDFDGAEALAVETGARMTEGETNPAVRAKLIAGLAAARSGAPEAPTLLHDAAAAAAAAGLRIPQAEAWIALSRFEPLPSRPNALAHAETLVDAIKVDRLQAQLLVARGEYQRLMGHDRDALASYHRALALLQDDDTRTTIARSDILLELGELANNREEWTTASQYLAEVSTIRERVFGPAHPELVQPLRALGRAQAGLGQPEDATMTFDRALAIAGQSSPAPRTVAGLHVAIAELEASRGQPAVAAKHYAEAVTTLEGTKNDDLLAETLLGLGLSRLDAGTPAKATPALERASVLAARVGWTKARRSALAEALGRSLVDADPEAALDAFRKALEDTPAENVEQLETLIASLEAE